MESKGISPMIVDIVEKLSTQQKRFIWGTADLVTFVGSALVGFLFFYKDC